MKSIRSKLVDVSLEWEKKFSVMPKVTSEISEFDAAMLVGCTEEKYSEIRICEKATAVSKGADFVYKKVRYQVKANRPSGKLGSPVTWVPKARNYDWDVLIWILYDKDFNIEEAWRFNVDTYKKLFDGVRRLSPDHMRKGKKLK